MRARSQQIVLATHIKQLKDCTRCPHMVGPVVTGPAVVSKVYLIGQAPGPHEGELGRPFAWTAGKMLFRWFGSIGVAEEEFRSLVYMAAVCRCFPGKTTGGGDRVPSGDEIAHCSSWMKDEIDLLKPELVIPVGRLAIEQVLGSSLLVDTIGKQFSTTLLGHHCDVIPLPHPSGASTWFKREPGKALLTQALTIIGNHSAWQQIQAASKQ